MTQNDFARIPERLKERLTEGEKLFLKSYPDCSDETVAMIGFIKQVRKEMSEHLTAAGIDIEVIDIGWDVYCEMMVEFGLDSTTE